MLMTFASEAAIRGLVREALATPSGIIPECLDDCMPVLVNPTLDSPLARVDGNIIDIDFVPHDVNELEISIRSLVKDLPDEIVPELYAKMLELVKDVKETEAPEGREKNGDIGDMGRMSDTTVQLGKTESIIRKAIRKILKEETPTWKFNKPRPPRDQKFHDKNMKMGLGGQFADKRVVDDDDDDADLMFNPDTWDSSEPRDSDIGDPDEDTMIANPSAIDTSDVDSDSDWDPEPVADKKPEKKSRKKMDGGVGEGEHGDKLADIAKELGISPAGVRRLMDTGLAKAAYMSELGPQETQEVVLDAADEYIQQLAKSGELDKADVNFLYKHIDMVAELDGFREFLHKHVRNSMKADGEWIYDKEET